MGLEFGSYVLALAGFEFSDWPFLVEVALEEAAELAGWVLLAGAHTAAAVQELQAPSRPTVS